MAGRRSVQGIVLVLASGLVALLFVVAAVFLQAARLARGASGAGTARTLAALTADSGMAYAAARLFHEAAPAGFDEKGKFSAWSGRVRSAPEGARFALDIASAGGKVPLNAGNVRNGDLCNKTTIASHKGLAHLLNNLGALLLAERPAIGRKDAAAGFPNPGERIKVSWLGIHLIGSRPLGGYRSLPEVRATLERQGYTDDEIDSVLPFISVGPYEAMAGNGRPRDTDPTVVDVTCPIECMTAPREVLEAVWLYVSTTPSFLPGITSQVPYGRSGGNLSYAQAGCTIYPSEAEGLARWLLEKRAEASQTGRPLSWLGLRRGLVADARGIFHEDTGELEAAGAIEGARSWARAKADLAFFAVTLDAPGFSTATAWGHWGIDHPYGGVSSAPGGTRPFLAIDPSRLNRVAPPNPATWLWGTQPQHQNMPYWPPVFGEAIWPPVLTVAPPSVFEIASSGWTGTSRFTAQGAFRAAERLEFTSQEDFENLTGGTALRTARGISVIDPAPEARRASFTEDGRSFPWCVSLPRWNFRGVPPAGTRKFPRAAGALALAVRASGGQGAVQYWPCVEDFTPAVPPPPPELPPEAEWTSEAASPEAPERMQIPQPTAGSPWWTGGMAVCLDTTGFVWPATSDPEPERPFACSLEGWCHGDSASLGATLSTFAAGAHNPKETIDCVCERDLDPATGAQAAYVEVTLSDWWARAVAPPGYLFQDWIVLEVPLMRVYASEADPDPAKRRKGDWHVALVIGPRGPEQATWVELYLNGRLAGARRLEGFDSQAGVVAYQLLERNVAFSRREIRTVNWDEWRLHRGMLSPERVRELHDLGRFVVPDASRAPTFVSPRYDLGSAARLALAGWTGLPSGEEPERVRLRVRATGFDAAGGSIWTQPLMDALSITDLSSHAAARSFAYEVEFVGDGAAAPLYATPFFESIWFTFKRPGYAGRWMGWE